MAEETQVLRTVFTGDAQSYVKAMQDILAANQAATQKIDALSTRIAEQRSRLKELNADISAITSKRSFGGVLTSAEKTQLKQLRDERKALTQSITSDADNKRALQREKKAGTDQLTLLREQNRQLSAERRRQLAEQRSLAREQAALNRADAKGNAFFSRFGTALGIGAGVGAVVLGIRAIGRELKDLVKDAVNTAAEFQKLSTSFTAILAQPLSEQGVALTPAVINDLRQESKRLFQEAQFAAIQTVATTKEYTQLLQTSLAVGQQVGLTQEQIEKITKRLVLAAGAFGIEITELGSSIGQIFTGTIRVTNQLGRSLGLTTKEQRDQLKLAIQQGTLFDFLEKKTRAFGATAAEVANNFVNVKAAVADIFEVGGTAAIQPLFTFLNQVLIQFRDAFIGTSENELFKPALTRIVNQIRDVFVDILPSLRGLLREFIELASAFGDRFSESGATAINLLIRGLTIVLSIIKQIISGEGLLGFLVPILLILGTVSLLNGLFTKTGGLFTGLITSAKSFGAATVQAYTAASVAATNFARTEAQTALRRKLTARDRLLDVAANASGRILNRDLLRSPEQVRQLSRIPFASPLATGLARQNAAATSSFNGLGTATRGATTSFTSFLGALGLAVGVGGVAIEVLSELTGHSQRLRDAQEKAAKSTSDFADELKKLAERTAFLSLIKEFDELNKKVNKSAEDLNRLNEIKNTLGQTGNLAAFVAKLVEQDGVTERVIKNTRRLHAEESLRIKDQIAGLEKALALIGEIEFEDTTGLTASNAINAFASIRKAVANAAPELLGIVDAFETGAISADEFRKKLEDAKVSLAGLAETNTVASSSVFDLAFQFNSLSIEIANLRAKQDAKNLSDKEGESIDRRLKVATEQRILVGRQLDSVTNGLVGSNKALARSELDTALAVAKGKKVQIEAGIAAAKQAVLNAEANLKEAFSTAALVDLAFARRNVTNSQEALAATEKTITDLEARIKNIGKIAAPGAGAGKGGGKRERDELADFLKEVERQLGIAKKLSDQIEKESDRVIGARRKLISELRESGALPFEQAIALEKTLIIESVQLSNNLSRAQQELIEANESLAKAVAAKTQAQRDRKDKTGTDNRDAQLEAITRLADNKLELVFQAFAEFQKAEQDLTELVKTQINNRIDVRRKELDVINDLVSQQADSLRKLIEVQERFGLISSETAARNELKLTQGGIEQRRKALINQLFPFADPELNVTIRKAFTSFSSLVSQATTNEDFGGFRIVSKDFDFLNRVKKETAEVIKAINEAAGSQDPAKIERIRESYSSLLNTLLRGGDKTTIQNLAALGKQFQTLTKDFTEIDRAIAGQSKKGAADPKLIESRAKLEQQITSIKNQAQSILGVDKLDAELLAKKLNLYANLNGIVEAINKTSVSQEQTAENIAALEKLTLEEKEALFEFEVKLHEIAVERLNLQVDFVNFDLQRLDSITQFVEKQKELGSISQLEARRTEQSLLKQKEAQLEILKAVLQQKLAVETTNLVRSTGISDPRLAAVANPQAARQQLQTQGELSRIILETQAVRDALFDLKSPLIAARDGFRQIAEAVGGLPAPFNELKAVFDGLAQLADFFAKKGRPKTPVQELDAALLKASDTIKTAGSDFNLNLTSAAETVDASISLLGEAGQKLHDEIVSAAKEFRNIVTGSGSSETVNPVRDAGKVIQRAATNAGRELVHEAEHAAGLIGDGGKSFLSILKANLPGIIQGIAGAAASILQGLSQGGPGGIISGIGGALGSISTLAPALSFLGPVGAVAGIVGGFISFFGARARKKTEEMAKAIQSGIDELKKKIASGAVNLGEGIQLLENALRNARRRLTGRAGGKEELAKIEADIRAEQERLREQAKQIQGDFRKQLALLRQPEGLRGIITQINEAFEEAKKFIRSFENPDDIAKATKEAMEFLQITFEELKNAIKKQLEDLNKQLKENAEDFERNQRDILLRGRIDPRISEAESKRSELIRLERDFRLKQKELQDQIKLEQEKLKFVERREKLENKIGRVAKKAADELRKAADAIDRATLAFERILKLIQEFGIFRGLGKAKAEGITLNLQINGQNVATQRIGVDARRHAVIRGTVSPTGQFQFNPVTG